MASPLPAWTGRYESARDGRSSNPDLIRNFNIYFLPGPTPIQPLEKRAVCIATQGLEITRWFPGAALQLEGTDALFSLVDSRKEHQFTSVLLHVNERIAESCTDRVDHSDRIFQDRLQLARRLGFSETDSSKEAILMDGYSTRVDRLKHVVITKHIEPRSFYQGRDGFEMYRDHPFADLRHCNATASGQIAFGLPHAGLAR
jgi:hypothetical protein